MSTPAPPTLLQLAGWSLLSQSTLAIPAVRDLPRELFPPLFLEAFAGGHTEVLRAMVMAWPFPCLPLGSLMEQPHLGTLQAVLAGLDVLLAQKDHPRGRKLHVLDLRMQHQSFWVVWCGHGAGTCPPQPLRRSRPVEDSRDAGEEPPLKVLVDLGLRDKPLDEFHACLFEWVRQRRGQVALCGMLRIRATPLQTLWGILDTFQPSCIQELEVHTGWTLSTLAGFAPCLGQMTNLQKLSFFHLFKIPFMSPNKKEQLVFKLMSHFCQLQSLRWLFLSRACFLRGHMDLMLRSLKTPLETLSITHCQLTGLEWSHLSAFPSTCQLRHLSLRGVRLSNFCPEPLCDLLEKVTNTLTVLDLEDCRMSDAQFSATLPALSRCTKLTALCLFGNCISMSVLKDLLCHTASMGHLSQEVYPAPLDSYNDLGYFQPETFDLLCAELMDVLCAIRQPDVVIIVSNFCEHCDHRYTYQWGSSPYGCWEPASWGAASWARGSQGPGVTSGCKEHTAVDASSM